MLIFELDFYDYADYIIDELMTEWEEWGEPLPDEDEDEDE